MKIRLSILLIMVLIPALISAQDLMSLIEAPEKGPVFITGSFKSTKIVIGQSIENPAKHDLNFIISHHFGHINEGAYNFWGLDYATIRLGVEYGIIDQLAVGLGRSTYNKTYDGYLKYKLLRQQEGLRNIPLSLSLFSSISINSLRWEEPERNNFFSSRLAYTYQLLIARKFSSAFSFQITPSLVHRNLVKYTSDNNDIFSIGMGGRYRITNRISFNAEYYVVFNSSDTEDMDNPLSLGFDFETGGHVFQLFFTNSNPMFESGFITETNGKWSDGDIFFGFNIFRVFTLKKKKSGKG
jgi:hypothetical protein